MAESDPGPPGLRALEFRQAAQTFRVVVIGMIALLMAPPLALIEETIEERANRRDHVEADVARVWGGPQTLTGPLLIVPIERANGDRARAGDVRSPWLTPAGEADGGLRFLVVLPAVLAVSATLDHDIRRRGLFESIVYVAAVRFTGEFRRPAEDALPALGNDFKIRWDRAWLTLGVSDTSGVRTVHEATFAGRALVLEPGIGGVKVLPGGIHARIAGVDPERDAHPFAFAFDLNGSTRLKVAPTGRETMVAIAGDWPHPSFEGDVLPATREVGAAGFSAAWEIPHLARPFPQYWVHDAGDSEATFRPARRGSGVRLYQPVDLYQKAVRATKYGLLFIALTLATFFVMECTTGRRLHLLQYGIVGGALVLFFLLLLSLAEHIGFAAAYAVATAAEITVVSVYVGIALGTRRDMTGVAAVLAALYLVLYFILAAEDYALLAGTLTVFAAVTVAMYATRNLRRRETSPKIDGLASGRA